MAYIVTFDRLTASKGFPWAIRVMGFIALAISLVSFPALLSGSSGLKRARKARKLVDKSAFQDVLFIVFTCASFVSFLGYNIPYFYIPTYAQDHLGVSRDFALYILVIAIGGSFFGRLGSGYVAHYAGTTLTWIACAFISGILALSWIGVKTEKSFLAFSALWGKYRPSSNSNMVCLIITSRHRLLLRGTRHAARVLLPQHMSRPLALGYSNGHVLGRLLHRHIDRGADCWNTAYEVCRERRDGVDQLSRCADLEWSMPVARFSRSGPLVDFDCAETEERHLHIAWPLNS
jgi:hypothetical protein